jgi:hypothetical protein
MKRIYLLFPLLALTAFAGFYSRWSAQRDAATYSCPKFSADPYQDRDGHQEAVADIARGKLGVVGYGMPGPWVSEYREVLQRDYGIEYRAIAGCVVSEGILKYAAAYNEAMDRRITALHGAHVFDDAMKKAEALGVQRHLPLQRE